MLLSCGHFKKIKPLNYELTGHHAHIQGDGVHISLRLESLAFADLLTIGMGQLLPGRPVDQ